jgi:hypothetical protein
MQVTIGNRKQIASAVLQVPEGEDAWLEFAANTWNVKLRVQFSDNKTDPTQRFSLRPEADHAVLVFENWNQATPGATARPFQIGKTEDRVVSMLASGYAVKGFKFLNLSFFWEV